MGSSGHRRLSGERSAAVHRNHAAGAEGQQGGSGQHRAGDFLWLGDAAQRRAGSLRGDQVRWHPLGVVAVDPTGRDAQHPDLGSQHPAQAAGHRIHTIWNGSEEAGYKIAARWTFQGTHTGLGVYGPPTGKRVRVLGISHFEVRGGVVVREYMVWNEFALLKQLHSAG